MIFFEIVSIFVCVLACVNLMTSIKVFIVFNFHKSQRKNLLKNEKFLNDVKDLYIFLPALREQVIVEETLNHFSSLNYPKNNLKIKILTTEREEYEYYIKNEKTTTTQEKARKIASEINKRMGIEIIEVIHYPYSKGNKASQLNYGFNKIKNEKIDLTKTYIGVFDFDSRPEKDILLLLNNKIAKKNYPDVIQPLPVFLNNISEISKKKKNFLIFCHGMFQAVRSFGIEAWRLLVAEKSKHWLTPIYCMGAGLFLKIEALVEIGGFPSTVDDIPLGFRLLNYNKKFCYLPSIVMGDLPEKTKQVFNQSVLIQRGNICAYQEMKITPKNNKSVWRKFLIWWEATSVLIVKSVLPFLLLGFWLYCFNKNIFSIGFILLSVIPYLRFLCGLTVCGFMKKTKIKISTICLAFIVSPIWPFCKTYGVWKNIKLSINKKFSKKELEFKKTERGEQK